MLSRRPRPRFRITIVGPQTLRAISTRVIMKPRFWGFVAMARLTSDRAPIRLDYLPKPNRCQKARAMRNVARPEIRDFVFQKERTLPAVDLLNRIPRSRPRKVIDLGCGPGYTTTLLARRFLRAEIVGIDRAEDALKIARARLPKVQFNKLEISSWTDSKPYDLIFSNGALQWAPRHTFFCRNSSRRSRHEVVSLCKFQAIGRSPTAP